MPITFMRIVLAIYAFALSAFAFADPPPIPETPAGQVLANWLDAFNSGDRARIEKFIMTHRSKRNIDEEMMLRNFSGGFDLVVIE